MVFPHNQTRIVFAAGDARKRLWMRYTRCLLSGLTALLLLLGMTGCPKPSEERTAPVEACTQVGERCVHSSNKLGVCGLVDDPSCQAPPCYECVSQH